MQRGSPTMSSQKESFRARLRGEERAQSLKMVFLLVVNIVPSTPVYKPAYKPFKGF